MVPMNAVCRIGPTNTTCTADSLTRLFASNIGHGLPNLLCYEESAYVLTSVWIIGVVELVRMWAFTSSSGN